MIETFVVGSDGQDVFLIISTLFNTHFVRRTPLFVQYNVGLQLCKVEVNRTSDSPFKLICICLFYIMIC